MRNETLASLQQEIHRATATSHTVDDYLRGTNRVTHNNDNKNNKRMLPTDRRHTAPASPREKTAAPASPAITPPPAPVSPSRAPTLSLPPPPCSPRYVSVLPDPMAEFAAVEKRYKEQQKQLHGGATLTHLCRRYQSHQLHLAFHEWTTHTHALKQRTFQSHYAANIIAIEWRNYQNAKALTRMQQAKATLQRNLLRMIVTLKVLKTRQAAQRVTTFVKQTVGPRFKTVIQTLRWKVIKCQRCVRSYLMCTKARLRALKLRFEKRVKVRCDEIRNVNSGRSQEYSDLKDHLQSERLRNVEEKWHDAHARVKNVMQVALTAASRAKRRRMVYKKRMRDGEAAAALQQIQIDTQVSTILSKKNNPLKRNKHAISKLSKRKKETTKLAKENVARLNPVGNGVPGSVVNALEKCEERNAGVAAAKKKTQAEAAVVDPVDLGMVNDQFDALALQYMHLPVGVRAHLLRTILSKQRKSWTEEQDEEKRIYENKVEIHRPIDCGDVRKMLKGNLHASELEKETIVRWERKPLELWSTVASDLDAAIDVAITKCVWDC